MRLDDLLNPRTGPETLMRLSLYPLLVLAIASLAMAILNRLTAAGLLVALFFLVLVSPVAYLIHEGRERHRARPRTRRGAERTPVLPPNEEEE